MDHNSCLNFCISRTDKDKDDNIDVGPNEEEDKQDLSDIPKLVDASVAGTGDWKECPLVNIDGRRFRKSYGGMFTLLRDVI